MDLNHYQRKMIGNWLLGVFAFGIGQVAGFLSVGAPAYAIKYFGDYVPWYLAIHIPGFAIVFALLFFVIGRYANRRG